MLRRCTGVNTISAMTTAYEAGKIPEIQMRHRMRIAREAANLEQGDLAQLMGVSRTTVSNTEKGRSVPQRVVVNAWALATGTPVSWLMNGTTPAEPNGPDGGDECARRDSNPKPSGAQRDSAQEGQFAEVVPLYTPNSEPSVAPVRERPAA